MPLFLMLLTLARAVAADQPGAVEPFVSIGVSYPASSDVERMRQDFALLRKAGFNSITTSIAWREGEPRRGAFSLLPLDRVIAVATQTNLRVHVEVDTETAPAWKTAETSTLAEEFFGYVRRRVAPHRAVLTVSKASTAPDSGTVHRIMIGSGALTLPQARVALWNAFVTGLRRIAFVDPEQPAGQAIVALGEVVGVITRNQALFAPLRVRAAGDADAKVTDGSYVSVHILESAEAIVIVGINRSSETQKATIAFSKDIPEAIWQNMETGGSVHFVMSRSGPVLEHTFAAEDVVVLAIRKTIR